MFRQGRRSADGLFTILFLANGLDGPRLGFALSRKNIRRAVGRNRLRRLVRESFRAHRPALAAVDIVVMARPAARTASNPAVFASLEQHWQRLVRADPPPTPAPTARDQ